MTATRWGRTEAAVGAIGAVVVIASTPTLPMWAEYLAVWTVLVSAVLVAAVRGRSNLDADGASKVRLLRFTWMDLLVGAFVGLLLRALMMVIEIVSVGKVSSSSSLFDVDHDALWFATAIVAPAILAPFVEELFFRGLVLSAIGNNWIGIFGSAIIFSAVHLTYGFNLLTAVSTFIVGLALGALAVRTKRLGASITAHIVYNASLIAMSELGGIALIGS